MIKWRGTSFSMHPLFIMIMLASLLTGHVIEMITLFGIVLIHELGHAAAATIFGWKVQEIKLLPFGGVAVTDEGGSAPCHEEIIVALAGPVQNLLMIGAAYGLHMMGFWSEAWTEYFVQANMMIALFNMIPVLPLDGGRIVQALCSLFVSYHRTLIWCGRISMAFSLFMSGFALMPLYYREPIHLNLLVIGIFLIYANWTDYRNVPYRFVRFMTNRDRLSLLRVKQGTIAYPIVVGSEQPLGGVVRLFMKSKYHLIYVLNDRGKIVAVLPEQRLVDSYFANFMVK
ncbi:site-2 protease family protein [Paenibacillus terrigena]|uniref:site-2 protease family protein n=1 Tax=Paenibacillus terrigena TaxID=369333 RepID=UPI0028D8091D|nr:M50 family metallopeptidase [Paenibacillus terrigena]